MEHGTPSRVSCQELAATTRRSMALSSGGVGRLYATVVPEKNSTTCKMTIRSKSNHSPETIKHLLKAKINPTEINVGINTLKTLNSGRVLIETNSK